ncbi:ABC transporter substrate-binding protein [Acidisoma silvae]|uniref:ABC transporter substrate-binding protein n=1 Tax=Acidisoma silvae TaxID=2802396 RepID=A0A963YX95_9PROT|nr:ABC transporter substrate-binding protein [Acidisoma silvae]MCB8878000.1 ABC transporter substrate-binding protein [Acidisoma silvae]
MTHLSRRAALCAGLGLGFNAVAGRAARADAAPVKVGVSGPLTGPLAQYGAQWKRGFDLALIQINGAEGGIHGRPLSYDFEDSQNDPRQAVAIAQKFVADPAILVELGDFSSTTSMAASPIYQRGKLVQLGFTNSHPRFTATGDYIWSPSLSQADEQPQLADLAITKLGFKRPAVIHLNTDWGKTATDLFTQAAKARGATIVDSEGYLPDERDFRSTLTRAVQAKPDGLVLESYYSDGALIVRQAREQGITLPIAAVGSIYSPKFIELAGNAANGIYTESEFFPADPRPEVQAFVKSYQDKYQSAPDAFAAFAYDALILTAAVLRQYGTTRQEFQAGLSKVSGVPSVIFGTIKFDPATRRVAGAKTTDIEVVNGTFSLFKGQTATKG